jgi:hypothetical protein
MLNNLSEQVRGCVPRAEECAYRAKIEADPCLVRDYLEMERRWFGLERSYQFGLARSYQFAEQLEAFSAHRSARTRQQNGSSSPRANSLSDL